MDGVDLIPEKLIARLVQSGKVADVNREQEADAVLTGSGAVSQGERHAASVGPTVGRPPAARSTARRRRYASLPDRARSSGRAKARADAGGVARRAERRMGSRRN